MLHSPGSHSSDKVSSENAVWEPHILMGGKDKVAITELGGGNMGWGVSVDTTAEGGKVVLIMGNPATCSLSAVAF